jgi:hypothetical protein
MLQPHQKPPILGLQALAVCNNLLACLGHEAAV